MNSGQALVSQAGHSMIPSMKGKQKTKGALAASLVGSLFSLVPGAAVRKEGFKVTMQHVMEGKLGPGTRLTRMPWVNAKGSARGSNIPETGPGIIASRPSGTTDPPVLEFSEATRGLPARQQTKASGKSVPIQAPKGVRHLTDAEKIGAHSGTAVKTAKQHNGSVAGSTAPGRSSESTRAANFSRLKGNPEKLSAPDSTSAPIEGTPDVRVPGKARVAGMNVTKSRIKTAELTDTQSAERQLSAGTKGQLVQPEGISKSGQVARVRGRLVHVKSQKAPDAKHSRAADMPKGAVQSGRQAGQVSPSNPGVKSVQNGSHISHRQEGEKPQIPGLIFGQVPKGESGIANTKQVVKGRSVNQQGQELSPASTEPQGRLSKGNPVPETPGSTGSHGKHAAEQKVLHARSVGRPAASSANESGQGAGSNVANSLTDQNGSRDLMMGNNTHPRGFVKPVVVGTPEITRSRKPVGREIPSVMGQSLLSPTQSTNEMSAALGSLARLTVSQYFRFVGSEQSNSVFTINGGSLGNVQLTFSETDSGTVLNIIVESAEIRQLIQRTLPSLERDWLQEGLDFSDVNVEVGDTDDQWEFSGTEDQTRIPIQQESAETLQVTPETIEQAIRDYGYNTLEFVA